MIKTDNPSVQNVVVFSDGAPSQFKQRFLLSNLHWYKATYELESLEWEFFATSHGKGAVDGLGGSLKRPVRQQVFSRKAMVNNAQDLLQRANVVRST